MRIIITGVSGVGKSSILEGVSKKINYPIQNYGTVMLDIAKAYGVKSRDDIRKQKVEWQRNIQKEAAMIIGKFENVIVDTHMSIKTNSGYLPGLPECVLKELKPDLLVLIEAGSKDISSRRKKDETRVRGEDEVLSIEEQQSINRAFATACSVETGANVIVIQNREGKVEETVIKLLEMITNA